MKIEVYNIQCKLIIILRFTVPNELINFEKNVRNNQANKLLYLHSFLNLFIW